jgi:predicted Rossmann fold nucleotide-binding protein DprA/Smf involved in DNA uptake
MKIAIVGSREFDNYGILEEFVKNDMPGIECIISGGARGADTLAEKASEKLGIPITIIKPDWSKYGKSAGIRRNREIVSMADKVIAFWDGESKGTLSSIKYAKQYNKELVICNYKMLKRVMG